MNYEVTKLDNRHSWHTEFKYMIEFRKARSYLVHGLTNNGVLEFDKSRRWFNEKFGWSQDVETRVELIKASKDYSVTDDAYNRVWAYSIKYNDYRIYVADEATLNWFTLSHPKTDHAQY